MDKRINFTWEELQLIHVASMMYGNELSDVAGNSSSARGMSKALKARAEEFWKLGRKVESYVDKVYEGDCDKDNLGIDL